jgi:hypothetical protein
MAVTVHRIGIRGRYPVDALHHERPLRRQRRDRCGYLDVESRTFQREGHLHDVRCLEAEVDLLGEEGDHQLEGSAEVRHTHPVVAELGDEQRGEEIRRVGGHGADHPRATDLDHDIRPVVERGGVDLRDRSRCQRHPVPAPKARFDAGPLEDPLDGGRRRGRHRVATACERVSDPVRDQATRAGDELAELDVRRPALERSGGDGPHRCLAVACHHRGENTRRRL